jgi:hypothetical protein
MAKGDQYMTYEQILQELQINRSQLNELIREGRLREHVISGETKFRQSEVMDLRDSLEKRPTVMSAEGDLAMEGPTEAVGSADEPGTDVIEGAGLSHAPMTVEEESAQRETQVLGDSGAQARETVLFDEDALSRGRETELMEEGPPPTEGPTESVGGDEEFELDRGTLLLDEDELSRARETEVMEEGSALPTEGPTESVGGDEEFELDRGTLLLDEDELSQARETEVMGEELEVAERPTESVGGDEEFELDRGTMLVDEEEEEEQFELERGTMLIDEEPTEAAAGTEPLVDELPRAQRGTYVVEDSAQAVRETDVLRDVESGVSARETDVLSEDEFEIERPAGVGDTELGRPLADETSVGDTSLETELDLRAVREESAAAGGDDFFDFSDAMSDLSVAEEGSTAHMGARVGDTDVIEPPEGEVAEEDLLSEIMEIEEEPAVESASEIEEDITAEITTMEEPTFEPSELEEGFGVGPAEPGYTEDFVGVSYTAPPAAVEPEYGTWPAVVLMACLVVLGLASLFVLENAFDPAFSTHLTSWAAGAG